MNSLFDPITLVFLGLAIFVIFKLRSVLGQKTGNEPPPFARREAPPEAPDNVVPLPAPAARQAANPDIDPQDRWKGIALPGSSLAKNLDALTAADPSFDPYGFVGGAKAAYEMIVTAFAKGDRKTLKDLLTRDVFDGFNAAIAEREKLSQTSETNFVSIDRADLTGAELRDRIAMVTVRFNSKIITATRDAAGKVVDGAADKVADVTDIWTFTRDVSTNDPNWRVMATEAGA